MSIAEHIRASFKLPDMIVRAYLEDLTDEELLVRPASTMNHIAWQLGHLIHSENFHINSVCPESMPILPAGFSSAHSKETSASDDPSMFLAKSEYVRLMEEQRTGSLAALSRLSDEELAMPSPDDIRYFGPTVGAIFAGEPVHWMMHAGQWSVVRRSLGRPPLF